MRMSRAPARGDVFGAAISKYWWTSTAGGLYFAGGFVAWGGTRGAIVSSAIFMLTGAAGLLAHLAGRPRHPEWRTAFVLGHLLVGQAILIWQQGHLPVSDYTSTGDPNARAILIFLVSTLIVGVMSMFGGLRGAVLGLTAHYLFIFDPTEEFSFKWAFPVLLAVAGGIVSTAFMRLERAYARLERLATTDQLTGLFNRRRLVGDFERLREVAAASGRSLLLVAWDLDRLKVVNDTQGHAAGDAYLQAFADALRANVRQGDDPREADAAFRVGGDEFVSLHLDHADGASLVARVRADFAHVSAGWVVVAGHTLDHALTQADAALYEEKARRVTGA